MTDKDILKMTWQVNALNDIYDAIVPWDYHRFACIMKDGSVRIFSGICDESDNGEVNRHLDCIDNDKYSADDIVLWIRVPSHAFCTAFDKKIDSETGKDISKDNEVPVCALDSTLDVLNTNLRRVSKMILNVPALTSADVRLETRDVEGKLMLYAVYNETEEARRRREFSEDVLMMFDDAKAKHEGCFTVDCCERPENIEVARKTLENANRTDPECMLRLYSMFNEVTGEETGVDVRIAYFN